MNRDDIIRMAQECGLTINGNVMLGVGRLIGLVAAAEREACARVCEGDGVKQMNGDECAAAIRARGEQ